MDRRMADLCPPGADRAAEPPPLATSGMLGWLRQRLFGSVFNVVLTVLSAILLVIADLADARTFPAHRCGLDRHQPHRLPGRERWAARSAPAGRSSRPSSASSCTASIRRTEQWRVNLTYALGVHAAGAAADPARALQGMQRDCCSLASFRSSRSSCWSAACSGLPHVETRLWGGLLVTLVISFTGIIGSLPLGILLALGRALGAAARAHALASSSSSSGAACR